MGMSDCPKCWDTPCTCSEGYLGSKIYEYNQLQEKHKSLEVKLDAANEEITRLREALEKADKRLDDIDVAMNRSASMAQEIWRHAVSEVKAALKQSKERYP